MKNTRPFEVKGRGFTTPKGEALWCHLEPQRTFNDKGDLVTSLVCDPSDEKVKAFITDLEDLRDIAFAETKESLGAAKAQAVKARPVYTDDTDKDGNATGKIVFKLKMKNIDERRDTGRPHEIVVLDAKRVEINNPPQVGNGSVIRCAGFANPYYMASSKEVGVSLAWQKMQIIDLITYGSGDDFGEEEGYSSSSTESEVFEEAPF